jgi:hypothetical protein
MLHYYKPLCFRGVCVFLSFSSFRFWIKKDSLCHFWQKELV